MQRSRRGNDRRVVHVELTKAGRETAKNIPVALSDCMNTLLTGFTPDEWRQLKYLLKRVIANAEKLRQEREVQDSG